MSHHNHHKAENLNTSETNEAINENLDNKNLNEKDLKEEVLTTEKQEVNQEEILNQKISELTDKLYRANADFENIKKRLEKEKDSAVAYANEKFAADMLAVLDALEEADKIDVSGNELATKMQEGIKHCISMVIKCFEKYGISVIETNDGFNPEFHNAIQMVEIEGKNSGEITQVYQKGYMYKGRVLRPSMVVVAK